MADNKYASGMSPSEIRGMSRSIIGDRGDPGEQEPGSSEPLEHGDRGLQIPEGHHVGRIGIEPVAGHDNEQCYVMEHHFELNPGHKHSGTDSIAPHSPQKSVITANHPAHGAIKSLFNGPAKQVVK